MKQGMKDVTERERERERERSKFKTRFIVKWWNMKMEKDKGKKKLAFQSQT